jgi:hypothetical protein
MDNKYFTESEYMARYIKDPNFCPYCEAREILTYGLEIGYGSGNSADFATATIECRSCSKKWCEVYELTAIEVVEEDLWEGEVDYSADDIYAGGNQ